MFANTLACSFAFIPASNQNGRRTLAATLLFATGAIVGWPFALALAMPFVFEELFVFAGDRVTPSAKGSWLVNRWTRLLLCGGAAMQIAVRHISNLVLTRLLSIHIGTGPCHSRRYFLLRSNYRCSVEHHQVQRVP